MAPQDSFIDDDEECWYVESFAGLLATRFERFAVANFRDLVLSVLKNLTCQIETLDLVLAATRYANFALTTSETISAVYAQPADDLMTIRTIEWKAVSQEELAQHRAQAAKQAKKKADIRQKELQKREVETANRKHLQGLRVVQKNLVYVLGLSPSIQDDQILQTLRGDKYFGQYGKIIKIVVSKAKPNDTSPNTSPLGVYVTFARKEDAAKCIAAVNGSQNGDRVLRAQLGTTKYCSAYLRNETCNNKQCMFLHEPGDNDDSYSRQDLSSINSANTQRPLPPSGSSSRQAALVQAPVAHAQPISAATQPMARENSNQESDLGDSSALPSSVSWATKGMPQRSRRGSQATSGAASSPAFSQSVPVVSEAAEEPLAETKGQGSSPPSPVAKAVEPSKPQHDPLLVQLLRAINAPNISFAPPVFEADPSYPPLFDENGGLKRRALREQHESRLLVDSESEPDLGTGTAVSLEEEQAYVSGSLQLGGEPDINADGRDQIQGYQTQSANQLPIQRGSISGGAFGGQLVQGFPPNQHQILSANSQNLSSVQRQLHQSLKTAGQQHQADFSPQFPPGMGGHSTQSPGLLPHHGHQRGTSRFSFNDSSSSSIKSSANPKVMAQQSSMMPSGMHNSHGGQYFGPTQGPPPGLKSTGTPPMFGQGQSFGAGSSFGGIGKESQREQMVQDMLRQPRGGSQPHDANKREYMFPSFLNQYPSASSTPAPASGLLASLYGPQTGAFQDFSQKQKKKGKKHRHANTSSSGGGGLVDVADPSILHARMQHQQQSNAGVGQVYGGQGQDDFDTPSVDDEYSNSMKHNVDTLLAGSLDDEAPLHNQSDFGFGSRPSTPSVPPGFESTHSHPSPIFRDENISRLPTKMIPTSAEFTPRARAATPLSQVSVPASPVQVFAKAGQVASTTQARLDTKALATSSGLSKEIASQAAKPTLQATDFPALDTAKGKSKSTDVQPSTPSVATPAPTSKKTPAAQVASAVPSAKPVEKKVTPGILNIAAPAKTPKTPAAVSETPTQPIVDPTEFPALKPAPSAPTAAARPIPKTLRIAPPPKIVESAKVETSAGATPSATPSSSISSALPHINTTRQPSLASLVKSDAPGTPTSEVISDNISLTDTSMSRANSPPPTRIGSAPVRENTKSMQKKARVQRAKEKAEQEAAALAAANSAVKAEPEPVEIAPVMGRKKRQKKDRTVSGMTAATAHSTPSASRAPSPGPVPKEETRKAKATVGKGTGEEAAPVPKKPAVEPTVSKQVAQLAEDPKQKQNQNKIEQSVIHEVSSTLEPVLEQNSGEKPVPTVAVIVQKLRAEGEIEAPENLGLLKPTAFSIKPADIPIDMHSANQKLTITPEDRNNLLAGHPVHKIAEGPNRIMLTPNGDCVRNLTEAEEHLYLELQARIADSIGPTAFISPKYHSGNGFTLIGGRAVPNGLPSFFPSAITNAPAMDPVSKIQRDEALSYINQYVLPSLSSNSQLEKALNANALDKSLLHAPIDASNWAQWSHDILPPPPSSHPETAIPSGTPNPESMLGLESITAHFAVAANNNSLNGSGGSASVGMLSVGEAESALQLARKEAELFEKRLNALLKKNRKLLLGSQH